MSSLVFADAIKLFLATLPFVGMAFRSSKINLQREYRGHQFLLPFLAVAYCIPTMLFVNRIALFIIKLLEFLISVTNLVPFAGSTFYRIFSMLFAKLRIGYGIQLLCNTVIMAAFCGVKRAALPIIDKWWMKWKKLYELTTAHFYTELGNHSVLQKKYVNLRFLFKTCYMAAVFIGALDCILALVLKDNAVVKFPFYPVFAIIVLGEITFFLDGMTYGEGSFVDVSEEDNIVSVDATELRKELKRKFGDRICLEDEIPGERATFQTRSLKTDSNSGTSMDKIAGAYFAALQDGGIDVNPDYVSATKKLLNRKSVLIYNPFYHDLTEYILLPMFHELLNHNSCLVVCGRMTDKDDIITWLKEGITNVTNLPKLWKIAMLTSTSNSGIPDIGVLGFENLYNIDNLRANKAFYERTSFVVLLEPSNLLGTGQIGIRSIIQFCEQKDKDITYCILDRNADGLIDSLSHVVRQSITEVIASPSARSAYSRVFWKADGPGMQTRILPRISHYMGIGTEIASLAMHEGVDDIHWYSGSKMPLVDLKWNVEQYYQAICQYIHSLKEQNEMSRRFHFHQNLWQADFEENAFVIAEDEFDNVFEMARTFAARTKKGGFINILSENYLLRDYMCDNFELFTNDPKAIPSIVPDYARTERNFVLRTIMLMAASPVDESALCRELSLHGCETKNAYQKLCELIETNLGIKDFHIQTLREYVGIGGKRYSRFSFQIDKTLVENVFDAALKSAYYIVENEQLETYPMGNRLMGHIEQVILPGQFFCYDGKYYQARSISAKNGIIVRRASEHLNGRVYYRQLRDYKLRIVSENENARIIRGMRLQNIRADILVETDGYLELKSRNLLAESVRVSLDSVRKRNIAHKEILRVSIPHASGEVRYTLCVLLNELFQTIYPNESGYIIAAPSAVPACVSEYAEYSTLLRALIPSLSVNTDDEDTIYFVEDSCIDLGILVSIERNYQRILEILYDYLDWYLDSSKGKTVNGNDEEKINSEETKFSSDDGQVHPDKQATEDVEGEDEQLVDSETEDNDWEASVPYLTYGFGTEPQWLYLKETYLFLKENHFDDSNIHKSRKRTPEFDEGSTYDPSQPGVHYCDFCGKPLEKGEYDILKDGRERCPDCSKDAIKTRKQFKEVYKQTLEEMERIFGISIDCRIKVRMVNAKKVNDIPGYKFTPTPQSDGRVLGYAQKTKNVYKLLVENGSPRWKMKSTIVHELSHIWQYENWDEDEIKTKYPEQVSRDIAYEGMAVWAELQYLMAMGEKERAVRYKRNRELDASVYGVGMKKFVDKYPIKEKSNFDAKKTPFNTFPPI